MTITGDLQTMAAALGASTTDDAALQAMLLVGLPTSRSDYNLGSSQRTYLKSEAADAEFLFEDGALDTIFVFTQATEQRAAYPRTDALIEGLSGTASREEVRARFGEPEWSNDEADRFHIDGSYYVRFGFVDDRIAKVSVMREVP